MALSVYLSAVNQKLLFAKRLLDTDIRVSLAGRQDIHHAMAIAQSATLQLERAWYWHLQDVASNYKIQDPEAVDSAGSLVMLLADEGKSPGEASELNNLASDEYSWVSALLHAHGHLYGLPIARKAEMDAERLPMVAIDVGDDSIDWNVEKARDWLNKMEELVERQRDMMIEF
jgi:hypothetical protein